MGGPLESQTVGVFKNGVVFEKTAGIGTKQKAPDFYT